ncbi:Maf family protein [Maricaulis sp.]|uniref:Maf family protein n=1 Tax=Maricaulis sp. TaxID=1486257 RepID=UPI003A9421AD
MTTRLILASGSQIRRQILQDAGIEFEIIKSDVDEDALKQEHSALSPLAMAALLGQAKAVQVSIRHPEALVLGADQTMEFDGALLDKLPRRDLARQRLAAMRGQPHQLHAGLTLAQAGKPVWQHQQSSTLWVRDFSDAFLDHYLAQAGDELTASVGAYAFEGLGAQLFDRVDGDFHAVLGLPLLPVLSALRQHGLLTS